MSNQNIMDPDAVHNRGIETMHKTSADPEGLGDVMLDRVQGGKYGMMHGLEVKFGAALFGDPAPVQPEPVQVPVSPDVQHYMDTQAAERVVAAQNSVTSAAPAPASETQATINPQPQPTYEVAPDPVQNELNQMIDTWYAENN